MKDDTDAVYDWSALDPDVALSPGPPKEGCAVLLGTDDEAIGISVGNPVPAV
jgi:hypothetical protein